MNGCFRIFVLIRPRSSRGGATPPHTPQITYDALLQNPKLAFHSKEQSLCTAFCLINSLIASLIMRPGFHQMAVTSETTEATNRFTDFGLFGY